MVGFIYLRPLGEYLGSSSGLGYPIAEAEGNFDAVVVFAGILILAIFVVIIDSILDIAEKLLRHAFSLCAGGRTSVDSSCSAYRRTSGFRRSKIIRETNLIYIDTNG
jgi:hypothetical protein